MDKKGQSLILMVCLLPVVILSFAYLIDVSLSTNSKRKAENLLNEALENNVDINTYFLNNNIKLNNIKFENNCYTLNYKEKTLFANVVGIDEFDIEINKCIE